jgi:hypothetical protein
MKTFGHHGLRRIVVMESANVAYADIEVGGVDSTQFVGSNGLGKTTWACLEKMDGGLGGCLDVLLV